MTDLCFQTVIRSDLLQTVAVNPMPQVENAANGSRKVRSAMGVHKVLVNDATIPRSAPWTGFLMLKPFSIS